MLDCTSLPARNGGWGAQSPGWPCSVFSLLSAQSMSTRANAPITGGRSADGEAIDDGSGEMLDLPDFPPWRPVPLAIAKDRGSPRTHLPHFPTQAEISPASFPEDVGGGNSH